MFETIAFVGKPAGTSSTKKRDRRINSQEIFLSSLDRERARVDRNGREFSLVMLRTGSDDRNGEERVRLAALARKRARATDELGWVDTQWLGVILPDTALSGGRQFAEQLCQRHGGGQRRTVYRVLSYPSQWFSGDDEAPETGSPPEISSVVTPSTYAAAPIPESINQRPSFAVEPPVSHLSERLLIPPMPRWKRLLDICGAFFGLVVLSPLMLVVAIAIKGSSRGPILFRQQRTGRAGKSFTMHKFRTMGVDAERRKKELLSLNEQDGPAFKLANDPRVTHIGRVLRKTSLDELPQLWNVLRGDMSLVGPRPLPCSESRECLQWQQRRLHVTPGLTCIWQIKGRNSVEFDDWIRMDIQYIENVTLLHDLKLIFLTVFAMLLRTGR